MKDNKNTSKKEIHIHISQNPEQLDIYIYIS